MIGYRDMGLYGTLADIPSLRRVIGPDVEIVDLLEIAQAMAAADAATVAAAIAPRAGNWRCDRPLTAGVLDTQRAALRRSGGEGKAARLGRSLGHRRGWGQEVARTSRLRQRMMLLSDLGGLATVPENDTLGAVTQLIVRYLTGQAGPYMEFYEFMTDRSVLIGVPDYVPAAVGRRRGSGAAHQVSAC